VALEGYDLVMLGVLAAAALLGYFKGMIWQVAWIAGIVVSSFVALRFGGQLAPHFGNQAPWNRFAAMLACYVASSLAVWMVFRTISGAINAVHLSAFDHQLGFLLGLAKGVLLCVVITFFSVTLAPDYRHQIVASRSGRIVADLIVRADVYLPKQLHETVEPFVRQFEQQFAPQSGMQGFDQQPGMAFGPGAQPPAAAGQASPLKALWDGLTNASAAAWAGGAEQGGPPGQPAQGGGVLPAGASWIVPGGAPAQAARQVNAAPPGSLAPGSMAPGSMPPASPWAAPPAAAGQRFAPQPLPASQPFSPQAPAPFPQPAAGYRQSGVQQPAYPQPGFQQPGFQQPGGYPVGAQSPLPRR
jgi:membrane protein required for colicin V production